MGILDFLFGKPKVDTSYQDFQIEEAKRARAEQEARDARIAQGMQQIKAVFTGGQFGGRAYEGVDPYLRTREQAQRDFYLPQLDQQAKRAGEDLAFGLARGGLINSSVAGQRQGDLAESVAQQRGSILSRIAQDVAGQRTAMSQRRQSVEAGLRASGDMSMAADQALTALTNFRQEIPEMNPLGNIFAGLVAPVGVARNAAEVARIRAAATPSPLSFNAGRNVG